MIHMKKEKSMFLKALEGAINEIRLTSYQNQYRNQQALTGFRRYTTRLSKGKKRTINREQNSYRQYKWSLHIDFDFIHPSKRIAYKRSGLVGKEVTMYDVANNFDLFKYNYIVFIEGRMVDFVTIKPNIHTGYSELFIMVDREEINGINKDEFEQILSDDPVVTILFVPNASYGLYKTGIELLKENKKYLSLNKKYDFDEVLLSEENYLAFINEKSLFTKTQLAMVGKEELEKIKKEDSVHLNVFGLRHLHDIVPVRGSDRFFRIDGTRMPVPKENLLVFEVLGDRRELAYDVEIKQYYPSTYELLGEYRNRKFEIYVFYFSDELLDTTPFINELEVYEKYMGTNPLDYAEGGIIHPFAKEYMPEDYMVDYSIEDFQSTPIKDSTLYKILRFNDWSIENPGLLKLFLKHQLDNSNPFTEGYYIPMKYVDLSKKIRFNNHQEIKASYQHMEFDEAHYLFVLREPEELSTSSRFYIDGEFYVSDKRWTTGVYSYHYIPKRLIKKDSIIEVEHLKSSYEKKEVVYRRLRDTKVLRFESKDVRKNDIFLVDRNTSQFIPKEDYTISLYKHDKVMELPEDSFEFINGEFRLNIKNEALVDVPLEVYYMRSAFMVSKKIEDTSVDSGFSYIAKYNNDPRQIRIFRNGRLLSQDLYSIELPEKYGGVTTVNPGIMKYKGDKYIVDITPNHYRVVYKQENIPIHGVLDLRKKIEKPIDLKWYDLYVNGRKLSMDNVEIISPMIIAIRNVRSLRNFVILERNDERRMSMVDDEMKTPIDNLYDIDDEFRYRILGEIRNNKDLEGDIITEIVSAMDIQLSRLVKELLVYLPMINPDQPQVHTEWLRSFDLLAEGTRILLDGNLQNTASRKYIPINPNDTELHEKIKDDDDIIVID